MFFIFLSLWSFQQYFHLFMFLDASMFILWFKTFRGSFYESLNLIKIAASLYNCDFQIHIVYSGHTAEILKNHLDFIMFYSKDLVMTLGKTAGG